MNRKWLCLLGIVASAGVVAAQAGGRVAGTIADGAAPSAQRWLAANERLTVAGGITDFPLPNPGSGPTTIAIAGDGTLWFTESAGNRIGRMAPDGTGLKEFALPNPNSSPRIIALGSDGNMWFSEHTGNRMGRITPDGQITEYLIPTPGSMPRAIALGSDGNIWFGEFAGGKIGRITPQGTITEFTIPTPDSGPRALAAGPDGNIWFSEFNASKIGRITPQGQITEFDLPRPNSGPGDITAGDDGNMWFVELSGRMDNRQPDGNRVGRITMQGRITEFPIPAEAGTASPINIAVGPDRNIWFTKGPAIVRVSRDGSMTAFPLTGAGAGGTGLTAGSDRQPPVRLTNRLWIAQAAGNRIGFVAFK